MNKITLWLILGNLYKKCQSLVKKSRGSFNVIVDLRNVVKVDSSGAANLVEALMIMRENQGELKLANAPEEMKVLLDVTKVGVIFEIYDSIEKAVESFQKK